MDNILERLTICWYALTKNEYFFCAVNRREVGNSGAVAYSNTKDTFDCHPFYDAIIDHSKELINKLEKNENN